MVVGGLGQSNYDKWHDAKSHLIIATINISNKYYATRSTGAKSDLIALSLISQPAINRTTPRLFLAFFSPFSHPTSQLWLRGQTVGARTNNRPSLRYGDSVCQHIIGICPSVILQHTWVVCCLDCKICPIHLLEHPLGVPPMFEQYVFFRPVLSWGWWVVVGGLILYFS